MKTPFLYKALELFSSQNAFGCLPHGGGFLQERPTVLQALKILKEEENLFEAWQMEKNRR